MSIDHRALLIKYIAHVGNEEGTTLIRDRTPQPSFTVEEWAELVACADEVPRRRDELRIRTVDEMPR